MELVKFAARGPQHADPPAPYRYGNLWTRQPATERDRLLIGPLSGHVNLLIDLSRRLPEPFAVLYVLLVSRRCARPPGRYECARLFSREALERFLRTYQRFLEQDARHSIWVKSTEDEDGLLVYDNHNVIYAYGPLESYEQVLGGLSFQPGAVVIPAPHSHHYHAELDEDEDAVISYWPWRHKPLQPGDDPGRV